jgi:quinolinate synthase
MPFDAPGAGSFPAAHYGLAEHRSRYAQVRRLMPSSEWDALYETTAAIAQLKRERKAIVLAHNYQRPEIFHGVADAQGDSLALASFAAASNAEVIVMCGVQFMAETAKLLAPDRLVLLPDPQAGCSLADSISAADVSALRERHPGAPAVCYVNTSAAVKAECDACCTSANAVEVVESMGAPAVIFVPDEYLAAYVAARTSVRIIAWDGHCEVHERFTGNQVREYRQLAQAYVLAHPECPVEVQQAADYVGSTSGMIAALERRRPQRAVLITECSMSDNISSAFPETEFVRPCNLCPHMQRITLASIRACLERLAPAVEVPSDIAVRARRTVLRMLNPTA